MFTSNDISTTLRVDNGPVVLAAAILVARSSLRDHVLLDTDEYGATIAIDPDGVPFHMWGSGAQQLWLLLAAMAYRRHTVSLYEVADRLDRSNTAAVGEALAVLFGGQA